VLKPTHSEDKHHTLQDPSAFLFAFVKIKSSDSLTNNVSNKSVRQYLPVKVASMLSK